MLDCDDIVIFLVLVYPVHVHTAKKTGAGTDSNVFLNIFGRAVKEIVEIDR